MIKEIIFVSRPLRIGKSETSGIHYSREAIEAMVSEWEAEGKPDIFGLLGQNIEHTRRGFIDLECVATKIIDLSVDDEGLVVHQKVIDTPKGEELQKFLRLMDDEPELIKMKVTPHMTGTTHKRSDGDFDVTYVKIRAFLFEVIF